VGAAADGGGLGQVENAALTLEELGWAAFVTARASFGADCDGHGGGGSSDRGGDNDSG